MRDKFRNDRSVGKRFSFPTPLGFIPNGVWLKRVFSSKKPLEENKTWKSDSFASSISFARVTKEEVRKVAEDKAAKAKAKIATGMKKAFSFAGRKVKQSNRLSSLQKKLGQNKQIGDAVELEMEVETEPAKETVPARQLELEPIQSRQVIPIREIQNVKLTPEPKTHASLATPTECLTCEKLIHCSLRAEMSAETINENQDIAPCRLTTEYFIRDIKVRVE